ncbi:hypothetical protein [Methylovorus sp. MP688]|uniref:hypothetical protein n=1 Tax=Methylovorus sp. (strain MP688) TaxID=887061 RepID=UPI0001EC4C29|nr:hypothetical protein [Methylovorus sp. MP688]ADQ85461.1 hypothetical protein MPQ_2315 [Methylovorus sp. MP688]
MSDQIQVALRSGIRSNPSFRAAVSNLRVKVSPKNYIEILRRAKTYFPHRIGAILPENRGIDWGGLRGPKVMHPVSLDKELTWHLLICKQYVEKLNSHVQTIADLTTACFENDQEKAEKLVQDHIQTHGVTIWSLEATIALLSKNDKDGNLIDAFNIEHATKLNGTIAASLIDVFEDFYNQSTTYGGFYTRLRKYLDGNKEGEIKDFYQVKFLSRVTGDSQLSNYLQWQGSYGYVDAYEGLMHLYANIGMLDQEGVDLQAKLNLLNIIADIKDVRLTNLLQFTAGEGVEKKGCDVLNIKHFPKIINNDLSERQLYKESDIASIENIIINFLEHYNEEKCDIRELYKNTTTTISKFSFLPFFNASFAFLHGIFSPLISDISYRRCCALSIPIISNSQSAEWINMTFQEKVEKSFVQNYAWSAILCSNIELQARYKRILYHVISEKGSLDEFDGYEIPQEYRKGFELLKLTVLDRLDNSTEALSFIVSLALKNNSQAEFLPFSNYVGGSKGVKDLSEFDPIDLVIALYFCDLTDSNKKVKFNLDYSCNLLLKKYSCRSIAELVTKNSNDERLNFILWKVLWKVLIPNNLKLVSFLRDIDEVENGRIEACQVLLNINYGDAEEYEISYGKKKSARLNVVWKAQESM